MISLSHICMRLLTHHVPCGAFKSLYNENRSLNYSKLNKYPYDAVRARCGVCIVKFRSKYSTISLFQYIYIYSFIDTQRSLDRLMSHIYIYIYICWLWYLSDIDCSVISQYLGRWPYYHLHNYTLERHMICLYWRIMRSQNFAISFICFCCVACITLVKTAIYRKSIKSQYSGPVS